MNPGNLVSGREWARRKKYSPVELLAVVLAGEPVYGPDGRAIEDPEDVLGLKATVRRLERQLEDLLALREVQENDDSEHLAGGYCTLKDEPAAPGVDQRISNILKLLDILASLPGPKTKAPARTADPIEPVLPGYLEENLLDRLYFAAGEPA